MFATGLLQMATAAGALGPISLISDKPARAAASRPLRSWRDSRVAVPVVSSFNRSPWRTEATQQLVA
jgi:hypothetical protein